LLRELQEITDLSHNINQNKFQVLNISILGLYNNDDDFVVEPENRDNLKKTEIFEKFNSVLHSAE
jgi:hypothetical protein